MKNALVPVILQQREAAPAPRNRHAIAHRTEADFIAHLIATAVQAPQTRTRRRADPADATAAYGALSQWPTEAGRVVSRSL